MLEVRQMSKIFRNRRGVQDLDFAISRGEIVGFLGPNGAGKTTTMRAITGYLSPTSGSVKVAGFDMEKQPRQAKRRIGYLPELPPLYPEMDVWSYLRFIADLREVPVREQKKRIGDIIDRLGLTGRENQLIRSLSKGYKQRVGLAQAILHEPDLLVLDEPTSGLDPKQIRDIRDFIRELGKDRTVLLSSHILSEIQSLCDRVLIIHEGKIVLDDQTQHIAATIDGGDEELVLEVKGPTQRVLQMVSALPDVRSIKLQAEALPTEGEGQSAHYRIHLIRKEGARERLFYGLADARLPIFSLQRERLSLEDVFLTLTQVDQATTQEGADGHPGLIEAGVSGQQEPRADAGDRHKASSHPKGGDQNA